MSNEHNDLKLHGAKLLPLKMESVPPDVIQKAEEELGETAECRQERLKEMRRYINAEKDFRPLMDDKFLIKFLRAKKFDADVAMKALKNYYTYKIRYSRVLTEILPSEKEHVIDRDIIYISPYRDPEGSLVGIAKFSMIDLHQVTIEDVFATVLIAEEIYLQSEVTQICGVVLVADFKNISLRFLRHLASPSLIYRIVKALQDCLPVRIKALHVINEPFYFSMVFNVLKKFLSEKMRTRFQFHGSNFASLHRQVPSEILPRDFGGHLGLMNSSEFAKDIMGTDSHFKKLFKYGYQEKRAQFIKKKSSMSAGLYL